jgi:hypothetical protein
MNERYLADKDGVLFQAKAPYISSSVSFSSSSFFVPFLPQFSFRRLVTLHLPFVGGVHHDFLQFLGVLPQF